MGKSLGTTGILNALRDNNNLKKLKLFIYFYIFIYYYTIYI